MPFSVPLNTALVLGEIGWRICVGILTRRPYYILSDPQNNQPELGCVCSFALWLVLCCLCPLASGQTQPTPLPVKAEPAGSSHHVPEITPPVWLCFYLKAQQEVLMWTSFLFESRNDEESCFLALPKFRGWCLQDVLHLHQGIIQCWTFRVASTERDTKLPLFSSHFSVTSNK